MNAGPLNMFVSLVVELYPQYLILLSLPYVDASYRCAPRAIPSCPSFSCCKGGCLYPFMLFMFVIDIPGYVPYMFIVTHYSGIHANCNTFSSLEL